MTDINRHKLYQEFQEAFPLESLKDLPLEKYTNLNKEDSFCYWLESRTSELGSIWGGAAYKFGIYKYANGDFTNNEKYLHDDQYAWYASYGSTATEAYTKVLDAIVEIAYAARAHDFEAINKVKVFGDVIKWKIAFLYSEESLVCFYKREMLEKIASILGMEVKKDKISAMQQYIFEHKGEKDIYTYCDELLSAISKEDEVIWLWKGDSETFKSNVLQIGSNAPGLDFDGFSNEQQLKAAYQAVVRNEDSHIPKAYWRFLHEIKEGDLVVVIGARKTGKGSQYNELYGWGRVSSNYSIHHEAENPVWRNVDWHLPYLEKPIENRELKDSLFLQKVDKPKQVATIKKQLGIEKTEEPKSYPMPNKYQKYIDLLTSNRNIVLTGAPGTGKTFMAKAIAAEMGAEVGFVQFHPSYDYTDFVEGLRPIHQEGNIGFERKDGVFKAFCKQAQKNIADSLKSATALNREQSAIQALGDFVSEAIASGEQFKTQRTQNIFTITADNEDTISIDIPANEKMKSIALNKNDIVALLNEEQDFPNIKSIKDFFHRNYNTQQDSYVIVIYEKLKGKIKSTGMVDTVKKKPFVFIIDEINRGEISKIFGELFFSIDPGYRGEKGRVNTQYQNLIEDGDTFSKGFFIPDNVYIIGTMNDIDRSVESMDFAMRRRFAWVEVKADDELSLEMLDELGCAEEAKVRMANLNRAILNVQGLNEAYQIGAAYFKKMEQYDSFDQLWENHIKGLLSEYLRGNRNAQEELEKLHEAFNDTTTNVEEA